jgi:hexosaminidase
MRVIAILLLFISLNTNAQKSTSFNPENLKIEWRFISNNYLGKDQYLFSFKLTNQSKKTILPADNWTIYYNANSGIVNKNLSGGLESYRLNGDLFYLKPNKDFKGLKPGESIVSEGIGDTWLFTKSDAPSGYYWVWNNDEKKTYELTNITITGPDDLRRFKRSPDEKGDQVTPEMIFDRNANTSDIKENDLPKIFPTPLSYKQNEGTFQINSATIITNDEPFLKEAQYLSASLTEFISSTISIGKASENIIQLKLDSSIPNEGYRLEVNTNGIIISASVPAGIFYGIQSLKCLLPLESWKLKQATLNVSCAIVNDKPRFEYRGLHIDVARNFQTKEELQRILNWMSMYKLNTLHFHFSEDEAWRIEIPALPELTSFGAKRGHSLDSKEHLPSSYGSGGDVNNIQSSFYTRNDYIEILRFAKERHIELIPEIETPGHARAAIKAMDARFERLMKEGKPEAAREYLLSDADDKSVYLSAQNFNDNIMCVALPSVYHFIETTVDALISMHNEAGMPLKTIHIGGDEVPQGVWEKSPIVQNLLKTLPKDKYKQTSDIWIYYWSKVNDILKSRNLYLSGWEEIGMRESKVDGNRVMMVNPEFANNNFHTYVWNTVVGWGAEDLPYRLANGGYKVILCPVSNVYFDLAYQKDFNEKGYYWGGFVDVDKSFYFIPYDYLKNTSVDRFGSPIDPAILKGKDKLTDFGKSNIIGIQGELWSENIRSKNDLEYLAFPKMLGLVERNWAEDPAWARTKDADSSKLLYEKAWSVFANTLGKKELYKLDYYQGGANFRIPTVGAKIINGMVHANIQLPGLTIRYTTDGNEPTTNSTIYTSPINQKGTIKLRAFDSKGRGGRTIQVVNE